MHPSPPEFNTEHRAVEIFIFASLCTILFQTELCKGSAFSKTMHEVLVKACDWRKPHISVWFGLQLRGAARVKSPPPRAKTAAAGPTHTQ